MLDDAGHTAPSSGEPVEIDGTGSLPGTEPDPDPDPELGPEPDADPTEPENFLRPRQ